MDIRIVLPLRPCDLNGLLIGKAVYKWQRASKGTKERVWAKLEAHVQAFKNRDFSIYEVRRFIDLECDDIFYKGLPSYTVQAFTADGLNRIELRQEFSGPGHISKRSGMRVIGYRKANIRMRKKSHSAAEDL